MSLRMDDTGTGTHWSRTTGLPTSTARSLMSWFRLVTDQNYWIGLFGYGNSGSNGAGLGTNNSGTTLEIFYNGGSETTGATLTVGTWVHLALTYSGTYAYCYVNGVLN